MSQGGYVLGVSVWGVHVRGGYVLEPPNGYASGPLGARYRPHSTSGLIEVVK